MSTTISITDEWIAERADRFASADAQAVLAWAVEEFGAHLTQASSLGIEDMVVTDILVRLNPRQRVFVLDTGRLHQETYDVMGEARARYGMEFEVYFPDTAAVERLVRSKGPNSFYESVENRRECCGIRKVEPLRRALSDARAWVTGLRRSQSPDRADTPLFERDTTHGGILKINPLRDWSFEQVQEYVKIHRVPYNVLHDRGFPSIGCAPCTRAIAPGEDPRAGRWWWEDSVKKECGLHVKTEP